MRKQNDRTYRAWGNNQGDDNLEDGAIYLNHLNTKFLYDGTQEVDHEIVVPFPSSMLVKDSKIPNLSDLD